MWGGVEDKVGVRGCRDPLTPLTQLLPGGFLPSVASFDNFQGYSLFLGGLAIALFPYEAHKRATEALLPCSTRWGGEREREQEPLQDVSPPFSSQMAHPPISFLR